MRRPICGSRCAPILVVAAVVLGVTPDLRADVKLWPWSGNAGYMAGMCVRHGTPAKVYKCKVSGATLAPPNATYWDLVPEWAAGQQYAADVLVQWGTPRDVYRCIQAHQSAAGNAPPTATHW